VPAKIAENCQGRRVTLFHGWGRRDVRAGSWSCRI